MQQERVSLSANQEPGGTDYVPPSDLVPLPSKGRVYPADSPLHMAESVEIRPMSAVEEDIITSRALLRQGRAISMLLRACLVNKLVDPDQMLVGDRNAVLVAVRVTGYGPEYSVQVTCPDCGEVAKEHQFDLGSLPIRPLGAEPVEPGTNVFRCSLPATGRAATYRLPTGADDREVSTALERAKKQHGGLEAGVTQRLIQQVVSPGPVSEPAAVAKAVRQLPARDSRFLRREMDRVAPGVEMKQSFACPACQAVSEVDVPLGTEFFWPH